MSYSCSDFVDDILEKLGIEVPDEDQDNPSAQADLAMARISELQRLAARLPRQRLRLDSDIRHDHHGFYLLTEEEADHEDAGNPSAGFDGRPHYATIEEARRARNA